MTSWSASTRRRSSRADLTAGPGDQDLHRRQFTSAGRSADAAPGSMSAAARVRLVALREDRVGDAPVGVDRGVVPRHAELVGRVVVAVDEVRDRHVGERGEAVGDAGRDVDARWSWLPSVAAAEVERQRRAVGGRALAQVVEHDPARRTARTSSRPGGGGSGGRRWQPAWRSARLPWIISRPSREPLAAVGLDEDAALVAVDVGVDDVHARDDARLGDRRPSASVYSRSTVEWSPSMSRSAPRPVARTRDLDVTADERVGDAGDADDAAALEHDRVVDLGVDDLAVRGDRGERPDVAVLDRGALRR